jgi:hypothetical protein
MADFGYGNGHRRRDGGASPDVPDVACTSILLASSLTALAVAKRWIWR